MFLQFFVWGSWFVTLGTFLGNNLNATGAETAMAFSTQSWGAIIAPLLVGLVADRYFNAERVLGLLHLTGAGLMFLLYGAGDFGAFYPLLLAYMICYMPTLALVNSVAFRQLSDTAAQFGNAVLTAQPIQYNTDLLFAGILLARGALDVFDDLLAGALTCLSHRPLLSGYDEPETLSYQIDLNGPIGADVRQQMQARTAAGRRGHAGPFESHLERDRRDQAFWT